MFENLFTTKMSHDAKKLGNRLHHILHPTAKGAKILSAVLIFLLLCALIFAAVWTSAAILEYQENKAQTAAKDTVMAFFDAFSKPDYEEALSLGTERFIEGYCETFYKMCYGMTRAELRQIQLYPNDDFRLRYENGGYSSVSTLTDDEILILEKNPNHFVVFSVTVMAEHNIKGQANPPSLRAFDILCQRQEDGTYRIHKFMD